MTNFSIQISFYCGLILFSFFFPLSPAQPSLPSSLQPSPFTHSLQPTCRTLMVLCNYRDKCLFNNCWYSTFSAQLLRLILFSHALPCPVPCLPLPPLCVRHFFFLYSFQSTKWMCLISNKRGVNSSHVCFLKALLPAPHVWFASRLGAGKHLSRICKLPPWLSGKATARGQTCPVSSSFAFSFEASWHPKIYLLLWCRFPGYEEFPFLCSLLFCVYL